MCIRWKTAGRMAGFLLSLAMLLTLGSSDAGAKDGAVTSIGSAEDLLTFAQSVAQGESYAGRTVTLTGDIDLTGRVLEPIGRPEKGLSYIFQGTFDGGGHAIAGLAVTGGQSGSAGLFAELYNATVRDLTLSGAVAANGPGAVGALAGWMVNGTVQNVLVNAQVTAARWSAPEDGSAAVGVIAGKATGRTVMDRVAACGSAAGAGAFRWAVYVGGFIGLVQGGGSITNCYTTATAFCNDAGVYVGGFFGGAVSPPTLRNCYAAAFVTGGRATSGAFAGYAQGGSAYNVWYDRDLAGPLAGVASPAGAPLGEALQGEATDIMQNSVFPSRLGDAFAQAGPGQNKGYPVFSYEAPQPAPTAEPSASPEPTTEPSASPEPTAEPSASPEPTAEPSASPEPTAEPSASPKPTAGPSASSEPTAEPSASPEPTTEPSASPEPTAEPAASPEPTAETSASPEPTAEPSASPESTAEPAALPESTAEPSASPEPTTEPSASPEPTTEPSASPEPTAEPSAPPEPTTEPSASPEPTTEPSASPEPTAEPSASPEPTTEPSASPELTAEPPVSPEPTTGPSASPEPRTEPSVSPEPTAELSASPEPTAEPSASPTPTPEPSASPETTAELPSEPPIPTSTPDNSASPLTTPTSVPSDTPIQTTSPTEDSAVPVGGSAGGGPAGGAVSGPPNAPRTGDSTQILPWLTLLILCSAALAGIIGKKHGPF